MGLRYSKTKPQLKPSWIARYSGSIMLGMVMFGSMTYAVITWPTIPGESGYPIEGFFQKYFEALLVDTGSTTDGTVKKAIMLSGTGGDATGATVSSTGVVMFTKSPIGITPTAANHLATKGYVDSRIGGGGAGAPCDYFYGTHYADNAPTQRSQFAFDADGNFYTTVDMNPLAGHTRAQVIGNPIEIIPTSKTLVSKFDPSGRLLWSKQTTQDFLDTAVDGDGNFFIIIYGAGTHFDTGVSGTMVHKFDKNGNIVWSKPMEREFGRVANIFATPGGELFAYGVYEGSKTVFGVPLNTGAAGSTKIYIAKINADGTTAWVRDDYAQKDTIPRFADITVGPTGDIAVSFSPQNNNKTYFGQLIATAFEYSFVAKLDALGNPLWVRKIAKTANATNEYPLLAMDSAGNILLGGQTQDDTSGGGDVIAGVNVNISSSNIRHGYAAKLSGVDGSTVWMREIEDGNGVNFDERVYGVALDMSENLLIGGALVNEGSSRLYAFGGVVYNVGYNSTTPSSSTRDAFIANLDKNTGATKWVEFGGNVRSDFLNGIDVSPTGKIGVITYLGTSTSVDAASEYFGGNVQSQMDHEMLVSFLDPTSGRVHCAR